MKLKPRCY